RVPIPQAVWALAQDTDGRNLPMTVGIPDQPIHAVDLGKPYEAVHDMHRISVVIATPLPAEKRQRLVVVARMSWRTDFQHLPFEAPLVGDIHLLDAEF